MLTNAMSPSCHGNTPCRQSFRGRPFLSAPYLAAEDGHYAPSEALDQCPWAEGSEPCRLEKHDWRDRKTGPGVPLRILHCHTHGRSFTVYPPAHVPYGRRGLAPVDLQGESLARESPEPEASCRGCLLRGVLAGGLRSPLAP